MIPFNFSYYKPNTLEKAISLYKELNSQNRSPIYYGGGTEFISMARMSNVYSEAVIDIKGIDECNIHEINVIEGVKGRKKLAIMDLMSKGKKLAKDSLILNVIIDKDFLDCPYLHVKRTKYEKIDYPLITIAALKYEGRIRIAFSGLCEYPFRSLEIEEYLNDESISVKKRIDKIIKSLSVDITGDISATKEYRKFVLSYMLDELLEKFKKLS